MRYCLALRERCPARKIVHAGIDLTNGTYQFLDPVPKGRDERDEPSGVESRPRAALNRASRATPVGRTDATPHGRYDAKVHGRTDEKQRVRRRVEPSAHSPAPTHRSGSPQAQVPSSARAYLPRRSCPARYRSRAATAVDPTNTPPTYPSGRTR
jgi:hypothetical protein